MTGTILVAGATGAVGSRLLGALAARGTARGAAVRALVRDPARARAALGAALAGRAELVAGDLGDPGSLARAVCGVEALFLACGNHPRQAAWECAAIDAAAAAGVRRVVKLSALGAAVDSPAAFWATHARVEAHLRGSGVPAVVLRPAFYMTNVLAAAGAVRAQGLLPAPAGGAAIAMVDPADVAACAAAVLTEPGHEGRCLTITGPEAITFEAAAAALSAATGRRVTFVDVPDEAARGALEASGVPPWVAGEIVRVFARLREGAASRPTDDVARLLGREPAGFAAFARAHSAAFAPPAPAAAVGAG